MCFLSIEGLCFPMDTVLAPCLVPLAQLLKSYGCCIRFVERSSPRFLDIYCLNNIELYEEMWTDAETSYYETCSDFEDE